MGGSMSGECAVQEKPSLLSEILRRIHVATCDVDRLGDGLHSQANRIFGHDTPPTNAAQSAKAVDCPTGAELHEALEQLQGRINRALGGADRLHKIG